MSLIMDALKRAQQLQSKGSKGIPMLKVPHPDKKRGGKSKKLWALIGTGLISLCILLFVLLKPTSPPFATQSNRTIIPIEGKPSTPVAVEPFTEPPKEVSSLPKDEEVFPAGQVIDRVRSKQTPNHAGSEQAGTERSSSIEAALRDQAFPKSKPPLYRKEKESLINQGPEREKLAVHGKVIAEKTVPPPPASQKEASLSRSIGVEQEGKKDPALMTEILNHFNLGVAFYNQKEFSKAIQAYRKVIELDPAYVEAYNNLGIIYQMSGEMERAFELYQKSIEINPRYQKGYNNLGILLFLKGRYGEAQEAFQKALAINSDNIESHINLGILFKKKGEEGKAIESYRRALAINPLHNETHYNIALLYEQLDNLEMATTHYQKFIQLSSKSHPELVSKVQRHLNALVEIKRNKEQ
jgi:tetratricopeptide (TPR) repeat protein